MSFFDQFRPSNSSNSNNQPDQSQVVQLSVNGGSPVSVPAAQAVGKTVSELFSQHAQDLGIRAGGVTRIVDAGTIVDPASAAQTGHSYVGTVNTDSKG